MFMDTKLKQKLLKQVRRNEMGDVSKVDNDLEKSLSYQNQAQAKKRIYKEFYDDIKHNIKEDW